jgi:hypothetical protein
MEKKEYEVPTMEVVQLQNTGMLMSSAKASMNGTFVDNESF